MTGIIILAAGASTRMGEAKQNLRFKCHTLLQTAVKAAVASKANTVAVVLGANANSIAPTIINEPVHVFVNDDWHTGMGATISYGLNELLKLQPELSSVLFMLTDQPLVEHEFINKLIEQAAPRKIIASSYNETMGPPVLFDKEFFEELLMMTGNDGAKRIIQKHLKAVVETPFPLGAFDIDTPEDYDKLSKL
ncbi:nucleotidyltransferase family protein [Mucilaginibacter sp. HD30]